MPFSLSSGMWYSSRWISPYDLYLFMLMLVLVLIMLILITVVAVPVGFYSCSIMMLHKLVS